MRPRPRQAFLRRVRTRSRLRGRRVPAENGEGRSSPMCVTKKIKAEGRMNHLGRTNGLRWCLEGYMYSGLQRPKLVPNVLNLPTVYVKHFTRTPPHCVFTPHRACVARTGTDGTIIDLCPNASLRSLTCALTCTHPLMQRKSRAALGHRAARSRRRTGASRSVYNADYILGVAAPRLSSGSPSTPIAPVSSLTSKPRART